MKFIRTVDQEYEVFTKPCPFCGSESLDFGGVWQDHGVYCTACMAQGPQMDEEQRKALTGEQRQQASIELWNKRV